MRKGAILTFACSAALVVALAANGQPPPGEKGQPGQPGKGGFGKGGGFGFGFAKGAAPGQIMPTFLQERLKLTDDQKKALADLQKEVDTKLDKMLTDEQRAELKKMKEAGPGGPGGFPGGAGGKGGFPGGAGGKGGPGKGDKQ